MLHGHADWQFPDQCQLMGTSRDHGSTLISLRLMVVNTNIPNSTWNSCFKVVNLQLYMDKFRQQWRHIHRIQNLLLRKIGYASGTRCALTTITWRNYMLRNQKHYTDELVLLTTTLLSQNKRLRSFDIYIYDGRSINKLQNDIILLIFKIWKFGYIRFVGNLIGYCCYCMLWFDTQRVETVRLLVRDASHQAPIAFHPVKQD